MVQRTKTYRTYAAALKRQGVLTRRYGICAGIRTLCNGCYALTFDPESMDHDS